MNALRKTIVFDWNGTLLDDVDAVHACVNLMFAHFGKPPIDMDAFRLYFDIPFERLYLNFGFTEAEIATFIGGKNTIFHDNYEPMADRAALRDGAKDLLESAKAQGFMTLILSNHIVEPIRRQLRRLKIDHLIDEVLAYPNLDVQFVEMTKGERLRRYMAEHRLAAEHSIIAGDTWEECHIAHSLGMTGVALTGGYASEARLLAAKPHHLIHSLRDMMPLLRARGIAA